jgi:predicted small secreted protein
VAWLLLVLLRAAPSLPLKEFPMRHLLNLCIVLLPVSLLAACANTASGLGEDVGTARLPTGLKLLDSEKGMCAGNVQVGQAAVGAALDERLFVKPGQNGTFEIRDNDLRWACVTGQSPDVETLRCPSATKYVRVTRPGQGNDLLFECYG